MSEVLKTTGLTKRFGDITAAERISMTVNKGEYFVVLGPSGAGKTTLLKMIAGLIDPDSGSIEIEGKNVDNLTPEHRNIAFLSQEYSLFPHMTVWENTVFGPTMLGWSEDEIRSVGIEMLNLVHLFDRKDAYPTELSGGMQQRNALARALARSAGLLLLDEPLRALDARLRLNLRWELRKLSRALHITTLHVTHDQEEAMSIADRIMVIRNGKILQVGTPDDVYNQPVSPFVANFLGQANFIEGTVVSSDGPTIIKDVYGREFRAQPSGFAQGERVVIGIKTERMRLAEGAGENTAEFEVIRRMFLGRFVDYTLRSAEGEKFYMKTPHTVNLLEPGQKVLIRMPERNLMVFGYPEEGLKKELKVD